MHEIYGPNGQVISYAKKQKKALVGEIVTPWSEDLRPYSKLPSQLNLGFDSSKLCIADYRLMREHHQVASSLSILSFMMYQRDWKIECDSAKVAKHVMENLKMIWPRVIRAMSTAFWAGYSPNALQWENDLSGGKLWVNKIKDLRPEECSVRWKDIDGVAEKKPGVATHVPRKVKIYNGINQYGYPEIPIENSYWYPLLMEEGDYYGRKLLNAAFRPWYFSMIMHLYANRYMERFAEPTPVGRAPFDDTIKIGGVDYSGNRLMATLLQQHKNGSAMVLPNSRTTDGLSGDSTYDYIVEYLESQLRGVEFDRVIQMYDEEISLALFTPLLLTRNTETGSSNLGVVHTQTYMLMLNALAGDWQEYLDRYLLAPMALQNFGPRTKLPHIVFRPLGRTDNETIRAMLQGLMAQGTLGLDLEELGAAAGLTLKEVEAVTPPAEDAASEVKRTPSGDERVGRPGKNKTPTGTDKVKAAAKKIAARVNDQATKAFSVGTQNEFEPDLGFRRQYTDALIDLGLDGFDAIEVYANAQRRASLAAQDGLDQFDDAKVYADLVEGLMIGAAEEAVGAGAHA